MAQTSPVSNAEYREWPQQPPVLYDWDVPGRRAGGMCDDPAIAAGHVHDELMKAQPGATGTIRKMTANPDGTGSLWTATRESEGVSWVNAHDSDLLRALADALHAADLRSELLHRPLRLRIRHPYAPVMGETVTVVGTPDGPGYESSLGTLLGLCGDPTAAARRVTELLRLSVR